MALASRYKIFGNELLEWFFIEVALSVSLPLHVLGALVEFLGVVAPHLSENGLNDDVSSNCGATLLNIIFGLLFLNFIFESLSWALFHIRIGKVSKISAWEGESLRSTWDEGGGGRIYQEWVLSGFFIASWMWMIVAYHHGLLLIILRGLWEGIVVFTSHDIIITGLSEELWLIADKSE